jgi:hypothetical protein
VSCPPGMIAAGLAQPRLQDGTVATGRLRMYQYADRDMDLLVRKSGRRSPVIRYSAKRLDAPLVISVGSLCHRR